MAASTTGNTQNAVIYGVVAGAAGFGIAKVAKLSSKMQWGLLIAGVVVGGYFGYKSAVKTTAATTA